jgi:hypothetical protein
MHSPAPLQWAEQQSVPNMHTSLKSRHTAPETQTRLLQVRVGMQSFVLVQLPPVAEGAQIPPAQRPEQQSPEAAQVAKAARQAGA